MRNLSRRRFLAGLLSSAAIIAAGPVARIVAPEIAGGNQALWLGEYGKFLEGMSQRIVTTIHYGNTDVVPLQFAGFAASCDTSSNVMDAGEPPGASWETFYSENPA